MAEVLVLGAGYAGMVAALRLAPHHQVTLVDPSDRFNERVRWHELAAGRAEVTQSRTALLAGTRVRQVVARATALDPAAREVRTDDGRTLRYDRLVYALGSRTGTAGGVLGSDGGRAYTTENAAELRERLRKGPGSTAAVVGGGLTGIELAAELAGRHPDWRVRLVTRGEIGPGLSGKGRGHVRATLAGLGVRLEEGRAVGTADEVDADVVVWAGSLVPVSDLAARAGLALDPGGRLRVDATLRSVSHPEVYVAGDAAAAASAQAGTLRMACATAMPTGVHAAGSVLADLRGEQPKALGYRFVSQCISLGRRNGLIQWVHSDDTPREHALTGRPAARLKEQVVRSTVGMIRFGARHPDLLRLLPGVA